MDSDFPGPAVTGQSYFTVRIITDHSRIDVAVTIHLRVSQETHFD